MPPATVLRQPTTRYSENILNQQVKYFVENPNVTNEALRNMSNNPNPVTANIGHLALLKRQARKNSMKQARVKKTLKEIGEKFRTKEMENILNKYVKPKILY